MTPNHRDVPVVRLDEIQLQALILRCEDIYFEVSGERLASVDFYALYQEGRLDNPFAMAWATYYEALLRRRGEHDGDVQKVTAALPAVYA